MFTNYLKKIKETARKDYKFEWSLKELELAEEFCKKNADFKKEITKVENARIEVKMDEHDWLEANPGSRGGSAINYVIVGVLIVGIAASAYWKFKK